MPQPEPTPIALDEMMLAMDVVDTLRHQEQLVQQAIGQDIREEDLLERLRRIYTQQGIPVSDETLKQGIQALKDDRFRFRETKPSLSRWFATLYVHRSRWGKWFIALLAALIIAWGWYFFTVSVPNRQLPTRIEQLYSTGIQLAETIEATTEVESLYRTALAATTSNDLPAAREAAAALANTNAMLQQSYTLRIVNEPNADTGVWRIPDVNLQARNYYIIVEALDDNGKPVAVPILNEETGKVETVKRFGMRVSAGTFNQVAADKRDDGIIQNNAFGEKRLGALEPEYFFPTTGGSITKW